MEPGGKAVSSYHLGIITKAIVMAPSLLEFLWKTFWMCKLKNALETWGGVSKKRDHRGQKTSTGCARKEGGWESVVEREAEEEKVWTSIACSCFLISQECLYSCQMGNTLVLTSGANGRIKHSKLIKVRRGIPGRVTHACNPSTWEMEAEWSQVQGQSEFYIQWDSCYMKPTRRYTW